MLIFSRKKSIVKKSQDPGENIFKNVQVKLLLRAYQSLVCVPNIPVCAVYNYHASNSTILILNLHKKYV